MKITVPKSVSQKYELMPKSLLISCTTFLYVDLCAQPFGSFPLRRGVDTLKAELTRQN